MNISYAPFDAEPPQVVQKYPVQPAKKPVPQKKRIPGPEGTECNYVVIAFVLGIMYLLMTTAD